MFSSRETSRSLGQPDTLILFMSGAAVFAYTDAEDSITYLSNVYQPIPLDRDSVTSSGTLDKTSIDIKLPKDTGIAELFRVYPPSEVVSVAIFQGHAGDTDFKAVWSGRVLSSSRKGSVASLTCEPISTSMKRPGLRRRYQRSCMHALYGDRCRLTRSSFSVNTTIAALTGASLTLPGGWNGAFGATRFQGGIFQWASEVRTILRVIEGSNTIIVSGAIEDLTTGQPVVLSLGCEHTRDNCNAFGNILNYGGQPWIPTKNPIGTTNQFY